MKYMIICSVFIFVCLTLSILISRKILRKRPRSKLLKVVTTILLTIIMIMAGGLGYLQVYYHADDSVRTSLESRESVTVQKIDQGYFFDGPGEENAVIFYPGAKIEEIAYAPMLFSLAESGADVFLVEMPFHFALLGMNTAGEIIRAYSYDQWYLAGHSMGGIAANSYASSNPGQIAGMIYLASYPSKALSPQVRLLSIYGSEDGCLDRAAYDKAKSLWPEGAEEVILEGGNHAGYANYGAQKGDGEASISAEEQQKKTVETIINWIQE